MNRHGTIKIHKLVNTTIRRLKTVKWVCNAPPLQSLKNPLARRIREHTAQLRNLVRGRHAHPCSTSAAYELVDPLVHDGLSPDVRVLPPVCVYLHPHLHLRVWSLIVISWA